MTARLDYQADLRRSPIQRGLVAAVVSALVVGVPTDLIDTSLFTRMTPVRAWEYPVLVLTAALTGGWFALQALTRARGGSHVAGTSLLSAFAVGCPVCNKIVVGLIGASGALSIWAPVQPYLGGVAVALLALAVIVQWRRWRQGSCVAARCAVGLPARVSPENRARHDGQAGQQDGAGPEGEEHGDGSGRSGPSQASQRTAGRHSHVESL